MAPVKQRRKSIFKKGGYKRKPEEKTRKQLRKEKRLEKKARKALSYQNKKKMPGRFVLNPDRFEEKASLEPPTSEEKKKDKPKKPKIEIEEQRKKDSIKMQLQKDISREDKVIKQLEKQLKLHKRKNKTTPKSFVKDGLDYLLDFCDEENRKHVIQMEEQLAKDEPDEDFQEDVAMLLDADESNEKDAINYKDDTKNEESKISHKKPRLEEEKYINSSNTDTEESDLNEHSDAPQESSEDEGLWEDIYGRMRDKKGNVISEVKGKKPLELTVDDNETRSKLKRQLKGLLNRLAESNMFIISNQVDELYMSNSRHDMNTILLELMMQALVSRVQTPDRLICEHMMLIAILHANVGTEIGAHFLLTFVKKFDEMLKMPQEVENKESDNLILMISHLYNFKIYGHRLLYQILEKLSSNFREKEIELILLILKTVGFPLRKDDPVALKELILKLQKKASSTNSENSRVRFMLDILMAIKNNNMSKIPQYDLSYVEHLKKLMKTFVRKGKSIVTLNISLEDLLKADERGKWWVVGSAWSGNRIDDETSKKNPTEGNKSMFSRNILDLARKQRMNTDIRRNIFCILMTAEDYLDAFEKLCHLGLKDQQEREIIYVLIDCCLQEKKYNPYYSILAQRFCECDRKFQLTIQYMLWDKFKILDNYNAKQLVNLARLLTHLFLEKCLSISVLKVLHFAELDKYTMKLVRQIIIGILLHKNEEECLQVFERISVSPKLHTFRESLRLFISHFIVKNIESCSVLENEAVLIQQRAQRVDKILLTRECKVMF